MHNARICLLPMSGSKLYALEANQRNSDQRKRFHPRQSTQCGQDERGDDYHSGLEEFVELWSHGGQFAALLVTLPASGRAWAEFVRGELGEKREEDSNLHTLLMCCKY